MSDIFELDGTDYKALYDDDGQLIGCWELEDAHNEERCCDCVLEGKCPAMEI